MKSKIIMLVLLFGSSQISAQSVITVPMGAAPVIDGKISSGEWVTADSVVINFGSNTVKVLYQHDSANLYLAYMGALESANSRFPEVLLDVNNDKGALWLSDDWWFHVSATDCEYQGQYGNYDSCNAIRPNWKAEPNFSPGAPLTDTVEIEIPFSTIGLDLNIRDTIGLAFDVTNTFNAWDYWPLGADYSQPSTWGMAMFENKISLKEELRHVLEVYPNPSDGKVVITLPQEVSGKCEVIVVNMLGKVVHKTSFHGKQYGAVNPVDLNLKQGTYLLSIKSDTNIWATQLMVQ